MVSFPVIRSALTGRFLLVPVVSRSRSHAMGKKAASGKCEDSRKAASPMGPLVTEGVGPVPPCLKVTASGSVSIAVRAKPGSKKASISNLGGDAVGVAIDAPAREGEANEALLEYLAQVLGVKKRQVSLQIGGKSREKVVVAEGPTIHEVHKALAAAQL